VANLSDEGPLALVVDDAHWADEASQRFLAYLARRAQSLPVAPASTPKPPHLSPSWPRTPMSATSSSAHSTRKA